MSTISEFFSAGLRRPSAWNLDVKGERSRKGHRTYDSENIGTQGLALQSKFPDVVDQVGALAVNRQGAVGVKKNVVGLAECRSAFVEAALQSRPAVGKNIGGIGVPDLLGSTQKLLGNLKMSAKAQRRDTENREWTYGTASLVRVSAQDATARRAFFGDAANANVLVQREHTVAARLLTGLLAKEADSRVKREVRQSRGGGTLDRHGDGEWAAMKKRGINATRRTAKEK